MRNNKLTVIILVTLLVLQISNTNNSIDTRQSNNAIKMTNIENPSNPIVLKSIGAGGEEQLTTNVVRNGDFEELNEFGAPAYIAGYGSAPTYQDDAYTGVAHSGSYSGYIWAYGKPQSGAYSYLYRYTTFPSYPYLDQNLIFDFWYIVLSNPDYISLGETSFFDFRFQIYDEFTHISYYMVYYQSAFNYYAYNNSNWVYIDVREPDFTWNNFHRNITDDYEDYFGSVSSTSYIASIYFYAYSPYGATGPAIEVIDEVSMQDDSLTEYMTNGDFETGTGSYWNLNYNGQGEVSTSDDHISGNRAANLTALTLFDTAYSYAELYQSIGYTSTPPRGYYANQPGETVADFFWKYSDVEIAGSQHLAYISFRWVNTSLSLGLVFILGANTGFPGYTNQTGIDYMERYYYLPGYGDEGSWHQATIDFYDYLSYENLVDLTLTTFDVYISSSGDQDSKTNLLMDKFEIIAYPTGDPGFEEDYYWTGSQTLNGWHGSGGLPYVDRTSSSHSGDWAANISAYGYAYSQYAYREINYVTVTQDWYTDFWWRIEALDEGTATAYSEIVLEFEPNIYVYYLLGSEGFTPVNNSNEVYYLVDEYNSQNEWFNLVRNLYEDLSYFDYEMFNLTYIQLTSFSNSPSGVAITLFDDINFVRDTHGPEITYVGLVDTPVYGSPVDIEVEVEENLGEVIEVIIHYYDGVSWDAVPAIYTSGTTYIGTIPSYSYDTTIEFYFEAFDSTGLYTTDNNGGLNYQYTVLDYTNPTGSIVSPIDGATVFSDVLISVECEDIGSGIDYVELYYYTEIITTLYTAPYEYMFDTFSIDNGTALIRAVIYDNAGNQYEDSITIDVENDYDSPIISGPFINPGFPEYFEPVTILAGVEDASGIAEVVLHYKIGGGGWDIMTMVADEALYSATIGPQPWNTEVFFYIVAEDIYGSSDSLGSTLSPHSYVVEDTIDPIMNLDLPSETETLKGEINIGIELIDPGSGIDTFQIKLDEEIISDGVIEEYLWDTRLYENGEHILTFTVVDEAGNSIVQEFTFTIHNLRPSTQGFVDFIKNFGVLIGAILGGAGIGTYYFIKWRKAKVA